MTVDDALDEILSRPVKDLPYQLKNILDGLAEDNYEAGYQHAVETVREWYEPEPPEGESD